jgi:hypothetical protein
MFHADSDFERDVEGAIHRHGHYEFATLSSAALYTLMWQGPDLY